MSISKSRETKGKKVKDEPAGTAVLPVPEQEHQPAAKAVLLTPEQETKSAQSRDGHKEVLPIPNLVKIQLDSYDWFLKEGLRELFQSFSPIEDFTGKLSLEFLDYSIGEPKYPVQECRERDVSYEAPLKVRVMLINKESKGEIKESEVYLGELPLMTERGTFIINGAERVVVSQLARSPGVYFRDSIDISGSTLHAAQCIPSEGGWVEFDIGSDEVISVRIGQTRKFPVTTLLRAFEFFEEAMPGPPEVREVNPQTDPLEGRTLADRVVDIQTGEILGEIGQAIDAALAERLRAAEAISPVRIQERPFPCATTPDLIRLFGEERVLGVFPRYAEDVEGEEGEIVFSAGELVRPEHLEKLEEWGYESLLIFPPAPELQGLEEPEEAQADLRRQREPEEWTLEELRNYVQSRALTVENLIQARSLVEVRVPGEVEPLLRPYQRISYPTAQVLVEMELETFPVIVLDAPVEATLEEDPIREFEEQLQQRQRQLEEQKQRLEKELQKLQEDLHRKEAAEQSLQAELQKLQAELQKIEEDLQRLRRQLEEDEEAQADLPRQIKQRQEEKQGLEKKLKKLEADLKRQRKQVQESEEAQANLLRQREHLEEEEEKQSLEKELQKLEANLQRKREQLKQNEEAQAELPRQREQLEEEIQSLQADLERIEADLPRLRTQLQEGEEAQADLLRQIEQREEEKQRLEAELQDLRMQVEEREKELKKIEEELKGLEEELRKKVLEEIYRVLRPGDPPSQESGRSLLRSTFFDIRRYDLARVGRFKINKKLGLNLPLEVRTLTKLDLIAIIAYLVALHQRSGAPGTRIERVFRQLSGNPDLELDFEVDDIDHLENKRVRAVGELLQNTLRLGFLRMERVARERMTSLEPENTTAQAIISIKPITAAIKSFFGSGALSQFMDQTNPLSELAHKRRLSAMGPGGLSRQSAKLEVRDVHRSHYGRICPIMTPEGPNIGLIGSLAMYARVDEFGFLETPYRRVRRGVASDTVVWLKADEEARYAIAPANVPLDENGRIIPERVICRKGNQFPLLSRNEIELMDVSPKQIFSTATSLIPFLENDDANRALMGSNMQRQAVPLVRTDAPLVKTGIERRVAVDSGAVVVAGIDGVVTRVTANEICIQGYDGTEEKHSLLKFMRTNQATFINQKPLVRKGQHVTAGQPIADGSCTDQGELALGRNVLVAFMPWEGYNYEDAIILSERMVRDDVFTSIHIDKYELQARETKLGPEEITGDIPNVGDEMLRNLDERGIIRVGVEIQPEDILVGKVAPKGQAEMTAEEKLVIAIFGKKAEEMRDTSLRVPHGAKGKVVDVKVFSRYKFVCQKCQTRFDFARSSDLHECEKCGGELVREQGDELPPGINQLVRVYVAQRRKIMEGDKMAGRHGNKGVIAKILPLEDMPHLPDGRPVDIILNPLGVPSRMNIGQILETHLGWVARAKGVTYENPVFQSMKEEEILAGLAEVTEKQRESVLYDYLSMEIPRLEGALPQGATSGELLDILRSYLAGLSPEELAEQVRHFAAGPRYHLAADVPHPHRKGVFLGRQGQRITEELLHQLRRYGVETVVLRDARGQEASRPVAEVLAELRAVEEHFPREELIDFVVEQIQENVLERVGFDPQTGKCVLYDGRTGEPFRQPVCIGEIYMMKLHHLVDDKIHARSTGPYSLVTQQPLGGKAQFGGQRFGEMEVWALEAYGAAYTLQEILTIKSDDVLGRVKTYENIVKGENILEPGIPESFKILIKELQSLGLQVTVKSREGEAMDLRDAEEQ